MQGGDLPQTAIEKERVDGFDRVKVEADRIIELLKDDVTADGNSGGERIRALELLGKIADMFVERKEVTHNVNSTFFAQLDLSTPEAEWDEVTGNEPLLIEGPGDGSTPFDMRTCKDAPSAAI